MEKPWTSRPSRSKRTGQEGRWRVSSVPDMSGARYSCLGKRRMRKRSMTSFYLGKDVGHLRDPSEHPKGASRPISGPRCGLGQVHHFARREAHGERRVWGPAGGGAGAGGFGGGIKGARGGVFG